VSLLVIVAALMCDFSRTQLMCELAWLVSGGIQAVVRAQALLVSARRLGGLDIVVDNGTIHGAVGIVDIYSGDVGGVLWSGLSLVAADDRLELVDDAGHCGGFAY